MANNQPLCQCSLKCKFISVILYLLHILIHQEKKTYRFNSVCVLSIYCSQKRKSDDLNGEAINGQNEVKEEEDNVEEVEQFLYE